MTRAFPRRPRFRLNSESYRRLCGRVLERDGWRCQYCGRIAELQVHHIQSRSMLGHDAEQNLIALCANCHRAAHLRRASAACSDSHL